MQNSFSPTFERRRDVVLESSEAILLPSQEVVNQVAHVCFRAENPLKKTLFSEKIAIEPGGNSADYKKFSFAAILSELDLQFCGLDSVLNSEKLVISLHFGWISTSESS
jgi:hypothetical protein